MHAKKREIGMKKRLQRKRRQMSLMLMRRNDHHNETVGNGEGIQTKIR